MSGHVFNASGTAYLAGRIFVFEREKMLKGLPARQLQADLKSIQTNSNTDFFRRISTV